MQLLATQLIPLCRQTDGKHDEDRAATPPVACNFTPAGHEHNKCALHPASHIFNKPVGHESTVAVTHERCWRRTASDCLLQVSQQRPPAAVELAAVRATVLLRRPGSKDDRERLRACRLRNTCDRDRDRVMQGTQPGQALSATNATLWNISQYQFLPAGNLQSTKCGVLNKSL